MDRRAFILLTLAGCASPAEQIVPTPAIPAPGAPPPPPPLASSGDEPFDAWRRGFYERIVAGGFPAEIASRELAGLTPDPKVLALDGKQPEFSKPVSDYIRGVTSEARISQGRGLRSQVSQFSAIETAYGVPRDILLGVWAMETNFGAIQGDMDVLRSLATLAAQGRRRAWAEGEILAALKMIQIGAATRPQMIGSWAGAMGQSQFLPSTYLKDAVDGDGDGRKDIWASAPDALASAANLLKKAGWEAGKAWHREVVLPPSFDYSLADGPKKPAADWTKDNQVLAADGAGWRETETSPSGLILPCGAKGPAFLVFPNHFMIRRYNNSTSYALGVGLLADRFGGSNGLVTAWPVETPLSLDDRKAAQSALNTLGFNAGAPDGVIGTNTKAALRSWQKARGLPADGYLSPDLIARLKAEAASPPAPASAIVPPQAPATPAP